MSPRRRPREPEGEAAEETLGAHTNSAERAVAVVEFLASRPGQTFTMSEIARRCGLRKSTAFSVLGVLHDAGWLTRSPNDLRYGLGPTLIELGRAAEETRPEVNLARPVMHQLSVEFQGECVLSTSMGDEILVLDSTGPLGIRRNSLLPGQSVPMVAPFGTVFIAWQDAEARKQWYRRSVVTDRDRIRQLEQILDETVRRGYVVTQHGDPYDRVADAIAAVTPEVSDQDMRRLLRNELARLPPFAYLVGPSTQVGHIEVDSLQAPIFDAEYNPRYALTLSIPGRKLDRAGLARLGAQVRAAADQVTAAIVAHSTIGPPEPPDRAEGSSER